MRQQAHVLPLKLSCTAVHLGLCLVKQVPDAMIPWHGTLERIGCLSTQNGHTQGSSHMLQIVQLFPQKAKDLDLMPLAGSAKLSGSVSSVNVVLYALILGLPNS